MYLILAAEGDPNPILPNIAEIIVGLVAFAILLFLLQRLVFPRFEQVYRQRTEEIEGGMARAEAAQAEAQRALQLYQSQLGEARQEAARLRENARAEGGAILAEMREQAQSEAARITATSRQQIETDRLAAQAQLRVELGRLAAELAGRIIGERLDDDARQRRTVDRFLDELEAADASGDGAALARSRTGGATAATTPTAEGESEGPLKRLTGLLRRDRSEDGTPGEEDG